MVSRWPEVASKRTCGQVLMGWFARRLPLPPGGRQDSVLVWLAGVQRQLELSRVGWVGDLVFVLC